mmetsp:Transcript_39184/g.126733  ORF Transcript_39184/g.126733 Transcript_39184/m.126733 type:complete len:273 (-) Transcript_39184:50-868(-)
MPSTGMPPIIGPAVRCARPPAGCCSPSEVKLCEERDCEGGMPYKPRGDVCCCACCGDECCACCGVCGCGGPSALFCWLSCCAGGEVPAEAACWWSCAAGGDEPAACAVAWACSWLRARQDPWQDPCGDPITELPGEDGVAVRLRPNPPMFACPLMPPMPPEAEPHMAWPAHDPPWPHPPPPPCTGPPPMYEDPPPPPPNPPPPPPDPPPPQPPPPRPPPPPPPIPIIAPPPAPIPPPPPIPDCAWPQHCPAQHPPAPMPPQPAIIPAPPIPP